MDCTHCRKLEADLQHAWRFHAEMRKTLETSESTASPDDYHKLQLLESNALLDLEAIQHELRQHEREHSWNGTKPIGQQQE